MAKAQAAPHPMQLADILRAASLPELAGWPFTVRSNQARACCLIKASTGAERIRDARTGESASDALTVFGGWPAELHTIGRRLIAMHACMHPSPLEEAVLIYRIEGAPQIATSRPSRHCALSPFESDIFVLLRLECVDIRHNHLKDVSLDPVGANSRISDRKRDICASYSTGAIRRHPHPYTAG